MNRRDTGGGGRVGCSRTIVALTTAEGWILGAERRFGHSRDRLLLDRLQSMISEPGQAEFDCRRSDVIRSGAAFGDAERAGRGARA